MNKLYKILMSAGEVARNWQQERDKFGEFAKPFWKEWGGDELVSYMMMKYVHNDELSIVEYLYNLDERNKELVLKCLDWRC